jgi:hypothetical protein
VGEEVMKILWGKSGQVAPRRRGLPACDCLRTHDAAARSIKGWFEWLFDMPEPLSGMEAEGVPHEDAPWYEDRIQAGGTMIAARTQDRSGAEIARALRHAGGHDVRRYQKLAQGWMRFTGEDEAKTA